MRAACALPAPFARGGRLVLAATLAIAATLAATSRAHGQGWDARAWADSARRAIETAYLSGEANSLVPARALTERALTRFPADPWLLHYRGYALYREATLRLAHDAGSAGALLEQAQEALEAAGAALELPETHALLASVLGLRIGRNPLRGITLGPKSSAAMERAVKAGPDNPRVWVLQGISAFHTPGMFGGGVDKAEQHLRRAIELFAGDRPQPPFPAWGHDEAWLWLGQVLQKNGKHDEARAAYQRALGIEPRNAWVREVLLPGLDARD